MESPKSDGNSVEKCTDISPSAQKSPFSKFLSNLSPIKSAGASRHIQRLSESCFPTTLSVFSSPHADLHRETSFHKREDIAASSSIAHGQCDSLSNSAIMPCVRTQLRSVSPDDCVGEYLADPLEMEVDSAQHVQSATDVALPRTCFTTPDAATQPQQGSRRHLQFEAMLECKHGAAFNCQTSRPGIAVASLMEPKGMSMSRQTIFCGQPMAAQGSFLGSNSVISTENGGNLANLARVPSHILQINNVAKSASVGLDVISVKKLAGYQSEKINDMEVSDPVDTEQPVSEAVLVSGGGHLPDIIEPPWNSQKMTCFNQHTFPCDGKMSGQQFADSVEELSQCQDSSNVKRKRETYADDGEDCKLCNCKRSKCLKLYCECFAAGVYCVDSCACENCFNNPDYEDTVLDTRQQIELRNPLAFAPAIVKQANDSPNVGDDGSSMTSSSARHKRGCKCKRSKCLKKYCECFRAKVGCSDGCRCEDCDNSFGKKSESINPRDEKWKNPSHEPLNTAEVKSDSIKGGTSSQFSPPWDWKELVNVSHLAPLSHRHSRAVPSLTAPNMVDCPNVSQAQSQKGSGLQLSPGQFHWCSSALSPTQACVSKESHELGSVSALCDIMEDGSPDIIMECSNPTNTVKSGSPNQKRVSPPQLQSHKLGSNPTPGMQSSRKLFSQDVPSFPFSTPCRDSEDHVNQIENDHGSSHDQ